MDDEPHVGCQGLVLYVGHDISNNSLQENVTLTLHAIHENTGGNYELIGFVPLIKLNNLMLKDIPYFKLHQLRSTVQDILKAKTRGRTCDTLPIIVGKMRERIKGFLGCGYFPESNDVLAGISLLQQSCRNGNYIPSRYFAYGRGNMTSTSTASQYYAYQDASGTTVSIPIPSPLQTYTGYTTSTKIDFQSIQYEFDQLLKKV